jgi:hypothetical protein
MATSNPVAEIRTQAALVNIAKEILQANRTDDIRNHLLGRDLSYYREVDKTANHRLAQHANRMGDPTKQQNVVVPVVAPQVETALAYLTEVFLSSYPIFPVVSRPQLQDEALMIETLLGESAVHYQWVRHLGMALRDGLKYNLMGVEVDWREEKIWAIANDPLANLSQGTPVETVFAGNMMKRMDMYNTFYDERINPAENHIRGDYVGYVEMLTRIELKKLFLSLEKTNTMNATAAFQAGTSGSEFNYYLPEINPVQIARARGSLELGNSMNWLAWAGEERDRKINYSGMYEVGYFYVRLIPKEIHLSGGVPKIYKFIVVNGKVPIYFKQMTNAHDYLPIILGQPIDDGYGLQTKSFADNSTPYQQLATSLYNSGLASQRKKVYDRIFYNPARINKSDIDKVDPIARIPVKTEQYAAAITDAYSIVPYRDDGVASIFQIGREVIDMADIAAGQNRVQRGQFQKGNKTRYEFQETMINSDSRQRMMAIFLESSFFQPIKHILKSNILQYQPPQKIYNRQTKAEVEIDPVALRQKIWEFQVADGVLPAAQLVNLELLNSAMQLAFSAPQMAQEWDIMGMFAYSMKLQGAKWVDDFRRPQGALANGTQQNNATPTAAANPPAA